MEFKRIIDNSIYTRKALNSARDAYGDYCSVQAVPKPDGTIDIIVTVHEQYNDQPRQVILEFWNYFLDNACKQHLELA